MAAERLNMALQATSGTATLGSTITVVDAGGKVVKTSKHLFSAFKEARNAYRARKAEIAEERACQQARRDEARLRAARKHSSSRRLERSVATTALIMEDDGEEERQQRKREKKGKKKHRSGSSSSSGVGSDISFEDDSGDNLLVATNGSRLHRSPSTDTMRTEGTIYSPECLRGNMSMISLVPEMAIAQDPLAQSLQALLMQLQATIDELSCLSAGLAKLISELQKVPDTLAVVAMTLAEAAAMVAKISPAAIMGLKAMFPMVFALLSSPQFTILAGVGVAATVVVLGGYKIIRNAVAGAPANASVSSDCDDDPILEYGEWHEPIEEITREPPQTRMIEDARAQNEGALRRRAIMPAPQEDGAMNALAFNLSSETSATTSGEEDKGRHRKHSEKTSESKSKSKSPKPEKKDKKDKDRKDKDKDKKEKHKDRERKSSVSSSSSSSSSSTPQKEKKPFFSLSSSPASSTTSLSSSGKKKERKSSVSALSSSPPKDKDGKKPKEAFMSLFEGRSA